VRKFSDRVTARPKIQPGIGLKPYSESWKLSQGKGVEAQEPYLDPVQGNFNQRRSLIEGGGMAVFV
jgi:hypothetical protein